MVRISQGKAVTFLKSDTKDFVSINSACNKGWDSVPKSIFDKSLRNLSFDDQQSRRWNYNTDEVGLSSLTQRS